MDSLKWLGFGGKRIGLFPGFHSYNYNVKIQHADLATPVALPKFCYQCTTSALCGG
jgi:hypothetical protein